MQDNEPPKSQLLRCRAERLRLIVVTGLVTFVLTLAGTYAVVAYLMGRSPPTPTLARPKAITVTIYPNDFTVGLPSTEIPVEEHESVMQLITPDHFYGHTVSDWITPLIAVVTITHDDDSETRLLVRWSGKNPATVSVDGRTYFYSVPHAYVHDGAMQLLVLIERIAKRKPK